MLFNSVSYIFVFTPVVFFSYFYLTKRGYFASAKVLLLISSLVFYGMWKPKYIFILLFSIMINYSIGILLKQNNHRRLLLIAGIIINIGILCFFKYTYFVVKNINVVFHANIFAVEYVLPLAISFYTFEQITYLLYCYNGNNRSNFLEYSLFITFFPKLIAGPIVYPEEMLPQYASNENKAINYSNVMAGLSLFFIGLFKKTVVADTLAVIASNGFDKMESLTLLTAWATSLSYTLQLYYDFSGYADMAIGTALLFNIHLPINFDSPYKAANIIEFWRTWHMTLSRFLKKYIYIPLGGNRTGSMRTYLNIGIVFLIGGFWHGAGWTFILWGLLHGMAVVVNRMWSLSGLKMNRYLGWFLTFNFVNIAWVFFRAKNFGTAFKILNSMTGYHEFNEILLSNNIDVSIVLMTVTKSFNELTTSLSERLLSPYSFMFMLVISLCVSILCKNSNSIVEDMKPSYYNSFMLSVVTAMSLVVILYNIHELKPFLYFNF